MGASELPGLSAGHCPLAWLPQRAGPGWSGGRDVLVWRSAQCQGVLGPVPGSPGQLGRQDFGPKSAAPSRAHLLHLLVFNLCDYYSFFFYWPASGGCVHFTSLRGSFPLPWLSLSLTLLSFPFSESLLGRENWSASGTPFCERAASAAQRRPRARFRLPEQCLAGKGPPWGLGFVFCISPARLFQRLEAIWRLPSQGLSHKRLRTNQLGAVAWAENSKASVQASETNESASEIASVSRGYSS